MSKIISTKLFYDKTYGTRVYDFLLILFITICVFLILLLVQYLGISNTYWGHPNLLQPLFISLIGIMVIVGIATFLLAIVFGGLGYFINKSRESEPSLWRGLKDLFFIAIVLFSIIYIIWTIGYVEQNEQSIFETLEPKNQPSKVTNNNGTTINIQPSPTTNITETNVEEAINRYRISKKLTSLPRHEPLCDLAKIRVYEIKTDWSHKGFEERKGAELYQKFCDKGRIKCTSMGENLASDFNSTESILSGWISSPTHKENLDGFYNVQCVAVSGDYVVSMFAYTTDVVAIANSNIKYDFEAVKEWESLIENDRKARDSWKPSLDSDWYPTDKIKKIISKLDRKIDIAKEIWNGLTNSNISNSKFNELQSEHNQLYKEIDKLIKEAKDEWVDNCEDAYEDSGYSNDEVKEKCEN